MTIAEEKAALRARIRADMARLDVNARRESDEALFSHLLSLSLWETPGTVLLYFGMGAEPDTGRLLPALSARGWRTALPRCLPGHGMEARLVGADTPLVRHPYGMLEPGVACPLLEQAEIDLILVPGLAFDKQCNRLGQGGGYYDRYLSSYGGRTLALCRESFFLDAVPAQPHDRTMDLILAETQVIFSPAQKAGPFGPASATSVRDASAPPM